MRLLSTIKELNSNGKYPSPNEPLLLDTESTFQQLDFSYLLDKEYIEQITVPDDVVGYNRIGHKITERGTRALERYTKQVNYFVTKLDELYEKSANDELYKALEDNRDLLRFAYYKRLITKVQLDKMAKRLQINVERIWWGDQQGEVLSDWGVFPS
jgi:hypothetical protein